nr:hypothetical protein [Tanacetum cinerariifolium]
MVKPGKPLKKKDQIAFDEEVARKLEAQMKAEMEEEERIAREKDKANIAVVEQWGWKPKNLKKKSFDEIQKLFDSVMKRVNTFVDMNTEIVEEREDLEALWSIVKKRFKKTKPVDNMDNLLFQTLKTMFEHHAEDNIWRYQQGIVKVLNWKLYSFLWSVLCYNTKYGVLSLG